MRDLFKTLEILKVETPMEYCEEFNGIKSILEYCNKHVKPFNKLFFRGGNEAVINELVRRLQNYLADVDLVDKETKIPLPGKDQKLRKILMFLMFNTDATYKYNLKDDHNIVHVLEMCPLMPKFLLVTLVWELHLDQYFNEMLSYSPCWFSFQYFEPATDSLKYIDDAFEVLAKVEQLLKAIIISISRSYLRVMDSVDKKIIFNKLYDYAMNMLRLFYTPDAEKFKDFNKKKMYKYSGFALKHLLQLVLYSFDVYENADVCKPLEDWKEYDICSQPNKQIDKKTSKDLEDVKTQQLKIITALLNALQNNVLLVKLDIFLYWVEIDLNEKQTLQEVVGVMAYHVGERMVKNRTFGHDVQHQLQGIAIKPKTLEEVIKESRIGDILNALDDTKLEYKERRVWFDELINRTVLALGNDECMHTIKQNIKLIRVEHCLQILDFIKMEILRNHAEELDTSTDDIKPDIQNMDLDPEDYEEISELIILALPNFNVPQILEVLNYECKLFGYATTLFSRADISNRSTEFFNKCSGDSSQFDVQQFLMYTFEQPQLLWQNFFECACHNMEHICNYTATVKQCRPLSNNYFQPQLMAAFNDLSCLEQRYFPALLCDIYFTLYYPDNKTDFLKKIIHKQVNEFLDNQQFTYLLPLVKCLNLINSYGETQSNKPLNFGEITAPVLLMAAQIMDKARWDLITYTDVRDEIVRECIQFIQKTSKKFLPNATEKDRKWITKVIKDSYKPLTQYYFQKYSMTPDQIPVEFDRFLIRLDIEDKSEAEMFLIINYVRCTMKETEWLARSERLLPHISDVMIILSGVVNETENPNAINNYRHCLANYANIVKQFLLPQIEDDNKNIEKLEIKVLKIISSAPEQIYEETFMSFESLLLDIVKKCGRPMEENISKNILKFVDTMKDCSAKSIFTDKFRALVTEMS
ncbi:gem-associated protein 4b-like [Haematobia irritans]|uniref:gem-associated protein 4b-like n=1 Tax=Haematobia irritans TaxID=7368 RepID=UPI003F4F6DC3